MLPRPLRSCVFGLLALTVACSYSPHPKDGEQECFQGRCVDGYVCRPENNRCYSKGYVPTGNGGAVGTGGSPKGTGGSPKGTGGRVSGGSGVGGVSGLGGATVCQPRSGSGSLPLIDDMADGDGGILSQDGRMGGWFSFNDATGIQTPAIPAVTVKPGWICSAGSGFSAWGAALGVSLNADQTKSCNYGVSAYQGVRFTIQGAVSGGGIRFSLNTADVAAAATTSGGTCVASSTTRNDCDDNYGAWLGNTSFAGTTVVSCYNGVSAPWTCSGASAATGGVTVSIPFASMKQEGWGKTVALNLAHVLDLHWQAKVYTLDPSTGVTSNIGPVSFDICIGNLSFY